MKFCCSLAFVHPDHLLDLAPLCEQCGWDTVILSDHVVNPDVIDAKYPYNPTGERMWTNETPWPDVWVATAMMAAVTTRLRFFQSVYVLPLRDPFHVAKAAGTLARMSNHRLTLGIGMGWMKDEFDILGQRFSRRGARADEMIAVMRKLWTGELTEHHGEFFDFPPLTMSPAAGGEIPLVVGGMSERAMRRVARLADGWAPAYWTVDQVREGMETIQRYRRDEGIPEAPLSVYTACTDAYDLDGYRRMRDAGISHVTSMPWLLYGAAGSVPNPAEPVPVDEIRAGIERFAADVIAKM